MAKKSRYEKWQEADKKAQRTMGSGGLVGIYWAIMAIYHLMVWRIQNPLTHLPLED